MFGPRGVLKCKVTDKDDPSEQERWGRVGKQTIEDTGPLTKKRMETVDEEFVGGALDFIDRHRRCTVVARNAGSANRRSSETRHLHRRCCRIESQSRLLSSNDIE